MALAPDKAEDFKQLLTAETLNNTAEHLSSHLKLFPAVEGDQIRPSALKAEVVIAVTVGGTDDVECRVYSSTNGGAKDTDPVETYMLKTSGAATFQQTILVDWEVVGSGFVLGFVNQGSTVNMVVDVKARRLRLVGC